MKNSKLLIILFLLILITVGIFGFQVYQSYQTKEEKGKDKEVSITQTTDQNGNVVITVNNDDKEIDSFSFDGGKTFQKSNRYTVKKEQKVQIVLKDSNGNVILEKEYEVKEVNNVKPTITISNFPNKVYVGDSIDLGSYATAKDANGKTIKVTYEPSKIETTTPGKYTITYQATDSHNNTATKKVTLTIIENESSSKENQNNNQNNNNQSNNQSNNQNNSQSNNQNSQPVQKQTYYSYRTKTISSYECNFYQCDYVDENDSVAASMTFDSNSRCCNGDSCNVSNPRVDVCTFCISTGSTRCIFCGETYGPQYAVKGNVCYDQQPIKINDCPSSSGSGPAQLCPTTGKENCDDGEIKIGSYCHKVDSYGQLTCPSDYVLQGDKCYKQVKKTCSETCTQETWSGWSDWSTTRVEATSTREVRTMER